MKFSAFYVFGGAALMAGILKASAQEPAWGLAILLGAAAVLAGAMFEACNPSR